MSPRSDASPQRYDSPQMQERRRRILEEARNLLSEKGESGFNIRELSRRADVSSRTLYVAFGNRDQLLAHAIGEYIEALHTSWHTAGMSGEIADILAEFSLSSSEIRSNPAFNRVLVSLYFSINTPTEALEAIKSLPAQRFERWLGNTPKRSLLPLLDKKRATQRYVDGELNTYRLWACGQIANDQLADELRINFLAHLLSITQGSVRGEIVRWHAALCHQHIKLD